ncbi:MAG: sigma 54-interacting transcriptional regulator [Desulfomonile tiedjei]|nr:sigma 54-interacting transcriptional regulator [Desulfomonile tiedjei]
MERNKESKSSPEDLRRRAEKLVRELAPDRDTLNVSPDDVRGLIHELQVYQAELEIQNEELRRAQQELGASRDNYADLYDFAPVGYFSFDPPGRIRKVNLTGARMLKHERQHLLMKPFMTLVSRDDRPIFYAHLRKVFETGGQQTCEIRLDQHGGGQIHARLESLSLGAQSESDPLCRTAVSDITELKVAQETVLNTQHQVLMSMGEAVCVSDEYGHISTINPAFESMFEIEGPRPGNYEGLRLSDLLDDQEGTTFNDLREHLIAQGHWRGEVRGRKGSGACFDADVRMTVLELFSRKSLITVWEDITRLKLADKALRESEGRFRAIFESAGDAIFLKDRSFRYTLVNPAFAQLFHRTAESICGLRADELFGDEGADYETDVDSRVLAGETLEEQRTRTVDGTARRIHEVRAPLRDAQGEIVGLFGIARDITEREPLRPVPTADADTSESPAMREALKQAMYAAKWDTVVLLQGETGSGKDYMARFIHDHSKRSAGAYVGINCAAVPPELAESELFGHERGSFTGAHARKRGLLEVAEGGTLLLNEIGDLPLPLQAKLLTFFDTKKITRVGGNQEISVNCRIIAATNRDLNEAVQAGHFREDLLYRLSVMVIEVPPLRERKEDIVPLVHQMLPRLAADLKVAQIPEVSPAMVVWFKRYQWPGNVRELKNVLERWIITGELPWQSVPTEERKAASPGHSIQVSLGEGRTLRDITQEVTLSLCLEALRRTKGNRTHAAELLGISRDSLYRHLKQLSPDAIPPEE